MGEASENHGIDVRLQWGPQSRSLLVTALRGQMDPDRAASIIAQAGANEVLAMATGEYVPETLRGVFLYRIYCLIRAGMTLEATEQLVASILKITPTKAKGLVNTAVARYAVELSAQVGDTIRELLDKAVRSKDGDRWEVRIPWEYVRERVQSELSDLDLPMPSKTERGSRWAFPDETYDCLRQLYDLPERHNFPKRVA